jgi:hypothetical protein
LRGRGSTGKREDQVRGFSVGVGERLSDQCGGGLEEIVRTRELGVLG